MPSDKRGVRISQEGELSTFWFNSDNAIDTVHSNCTLTPGFIIGSHLSKINGLFWTDEDGQIKNGYTLNVFASRVWKELSKFDILDISMIYGPVAITGETDKQGNILGLSEGHINLIQGILANV